MKMLFNSLTGQDKNVKLEEKANISKCVYHKNKNSVIYLKDEKDFMANALVLAHEIAHYQIYKKEKNRYLVLKILEISRLILLILTVIIAIIGLITMSKGNNGPTVILISVAVIAIISEVIFELYCKMDENQAEIQALNMLRKHKALNIDMNQLEKLNAYRIDKVIKKNFFINLIVFIVAVSVILLAYFVVICFSPLI